MITQTTLNIAHGIALYLAGFVDCIHDDPDSRTYSVALSDLLNQVEQGEETFGYRAGHVCVASGSFRSAFIFPRFVIKVAQRVDRMSSLRHEYEFITKMRRKPSLAKYFPETYLIDLGDVAVLVQERVNTSHRRKNTRLASIMGEVLGLDDMHEGNFGWKRSGGEEHPVFIDVEFRHDHRKLPRRRRPIREWERMALASSLSIY